MNHRLVTALWLIPLGVVSAVLTSVVIVWLLSQAVGFRFMPVLVASLSGSFSAIILGTRLWRSRA